ncbi:MAG TPA: recombinase RecA [Dehalococcoidia bacterium]|jgi:recombination protein RecA|nr:recombinase RecA [Dehalococcoidia bacterium]
MARSEKTPAYSGTDPVKKDQALKDALADIEKRYGHGAIMKLGDARDFEVEVISTGSLALDMALGVAGLPRGRITEIYGPEGAGKSTLAYHVVASAQKTGGVAAYIDVEHALDKDHAESCGINVAELLISQPDTGEQALEICDALVRSNAVDVIVVDSVAALVPRAEIEGEMGDSLPGLQARLMSQALRKLTAVISKSRSTVIFINQLREKIGIVFGNPETTPGGRALKFYSSVRIELRRAESLKQGTDIIGNRVRAKVVKNKVAAPFRTAEFDILFSGKHRGISREGDIVDLGVDANVVKKMGAFFSYGELRLGQGREAAKEYLRQNPELAREIEALIVSTTPGAVAAASTNGRSKTPIEPDEPVEA